MNSTAKEATVKAVEDVDAKLTDTKPCPHCGKPVEVYGPLGAISILRECPAWLLKNFIKILRKILAEKQND